MVYRTVDGVLHPDGKVLLPTAGEEAASADTGDYLETLQDYEERLARGEIQWQ